MNKNPVTITPLLKTHIEMVRHWRNQPFVKAQMEYQKFISKEEQAIWFNHVKNDEKCAYFIILAHQQPIGLIHLAKIDNAKKHAEVGLFIGEPLYIGTGAAFAASFELLRLAFNEFKLDTVYAKIKNSNSLVKSYNSFLGFSFSHHLNNEFEYWKLDKTNYVKRSKTIERLTEHI